MDYSAEKRKVNFCVVILREFLYKSKGLDDDYTSCFPTITSADISNFVK